VRSLVLCAVAASLTACTASEHVSRGLGASCASNADCDLRCLPDPGWPGGFCTRDCERTTDCPVGAECVDTPEGTVCLFLCFDDDDCKFLDAPARMDWKCRGFPGEEGERSVCAPMEGEG
jgi:hypothetical protein